MNDSTTRSTKARSDSVPLVKACSSHRVHRACIRVIDGSTFAVATQLTLLLLYTKTYDSVVRSLLIVYCVKVNKGEVLVDVEQRVISSLYYPKSVRVSF